MEPTIGALADELLSLDDQIKRLNSQVSELKKTKDETEQLLIKAMDGQGTTKATGSHGQSVTLNESIVPTVENWDEVYEYIRSGNNNDRFGLIQKRMSVTAYREETKILSDNVPGTLPHTKRAISLRRK